MIQAKCVWPRECIFRTAVQWHCDSPLDQYRISVKLSPAFPEIGRTSSMRYADAGVDISRAEQAKERIRRMASRTFTRGVVGGIGAFGGSSRWT